ncbi:hypothetical protein OG552_00425 [Streptomyces sp. NBC_01476]|uniref:MAB_1171c family putative transporter n=1 Tax=Streptomyces sp. NBC_01476 TaxID=2903881 RepID=UPI002E2F90E5|nr:MAB_1171c family putative transporter [Streptomyces sp. NBC_01476]
MTDVAGCLTAAVFLVFAVHRFTVTRGEAADPAQLRVAGFALCMGAAVLLNAPTAAAAVDAIAPPWGVALLVTHGLKTGAFTCLATLALALDPQAAGPDAERRRRRRQIRLAVAVQAGAVGLFLAAGTRTGDGYVAAADGRGWVLALYNALYAGYGWWCLLGLVRALARHTRRIAPSLLRTGLRLMMLAAAVGAVWTLWVQEDVVADLAHGRQGLGADPVSTALAAVTSLLATGGATTTLWGDRIAAPVRWLRAYRTYRALEPLWAELHATLPEIALSSSASAGGPRLRHAEFALYRRVIEIRDGHVALRPYLQPRAPAWVTEAPGGTGGGPLDPDAVVEAAVIAAALENRRAGRLPDGAPESREYGHGPRTALLETVEDEAAWLVQVTRAFARSPAVEDVRNRVRAQWQGTERVG